MTKGVNKMTNKLPLQLNIQFFAGITRLADVIEPTYFTNYVVNRVVEKSAIINSGIAEHSEEYDMLASQASTLIEMPFYNDLTGDSEVITDTGALTPEGLTTGKDVAKKQMRAKSWGANGLAGALTKTDPMGVIGELVADFWVKDMQKILLAQLEGLFKGAGMDALVHDISAADTTTNPDAGLLTGSSFVDATQKLGDAKDNVTAVIMHSAVEAYLVKRQLIEYSEQTNELGQVIRVPYFMSKRVIVDDAAPFDPTSLTATMYIFGPGAIALGNGSDQNIIQTEVDRDSLASSGEDFLITRRIFLLHARGVKWTNSSIAGTFPTNAELANGANYERVYDAKKLRFIRFAFRIANI